MADSTDRILTQWRQVWSAAFVEAENLLQAHEPKDWEAMEHKDRYWAYLPVIAMNMVQEIRNMSGFLEQAPAASVEAHFAQMDRIIAKVGQRERGPGQREIV